MTTLDPLAVSLVCPRNDAESATILTIGKRLGMDIRQSQQQSWFCPLENEPASTLSRLRHSICIVEMPGVEKEEMLRQSGHRVFIIDHHDYHSFGLSRWSAQSSLEQFAALSGYVLSTDEQILAWNDQEYIYGLAARAVPPEKQRWVRAFDLREQGYSEQELSRAKQELLSGTQLSNGIYRYTLAHNRFSALIDEHVFAHRGRLTNIWCVGMSADKGRAFFFTGQADVVRRLALLGGFSKLSNGQYGIWGGYELGSEAVDLRLASSLLSEPGIEKS